MFSRTPDTDDSELRRGRREYAAVNSRGHKIPAKYRSQSRANGVSCDWLSAVEQKNIYTARNII